MKDSKNSPKIQLDDPGGKEAKSQAKKKKNGLKNKKLISKVLIRRKGDKIIIGKDKIIQKGVNGLFKKADKDKSTEQVLKSAKEDIVAFLKMGDSIKEWLGDPKKAADNKKKINKWAKKVLTDDEYNLIPELKIEWKMPNNYTTALCFLDIRLKEYEKQVREGKLNADEMNMSQEEFNQAMKIFEEEIKKKDDEDDGYDGVKEEAKEQVDHIREIEEAFQMPLEDLISLAEEAGIDPNLMKVDDDEESDEEDAQVNIESFVDKIDAKELVEKVNPEIKDEIGKIYSGKINLAAQKEDKIGKLVDAVNKRKQIAKEVDLIKTKIVSCNQKLNINNVNDIRNILNNNQLHLDEINQIIMLVMKDKNVTNNDMYIALSLSIILREITDIKALTQRIMDTLDAKEQENIEAKNFERRPGLVKKVTSGNYLTEQQLSQMSEVQKQLRNVRDFVQMPKWDIWRKFKDEEKKEYFDNRIKWNMSRLRFLTDRALGKMNKDFDIDDADIPKALNCHVYYMDKFDTGFVIKKEEWEKLYKSQSDDLRMKLCELRVLAKSILAKLEKEKKITGVLRYKGEFIQTRGHAFFNLDMETIFRKKMQYAKSIPPWAYQMNVNRQPAFKKNNNNRKFLNRKKRKPDNAGNDEDDHFGERNFRPDVVKK